MGHSWAVVATVKEDLETIKAFVSHYKSIGADQIHLFFDDPADPALDLVAGIPGVQAVACDAAHWQGDRPDTHQMRQRRNANRVYARCQTDWLIHLDADELLYADRPFARLLQEAGPELRVLRLQPAEAMAGGRGDGVSYFRLALPRTARGDRIGQSVYGNVYPLLEAGLLSHAAGKFFVRTGLKNAMLSIHAPFIDGQRDTGATVARAYLLHFHGHDQARWIASVERRLERGAYQASFNENKRNAGTVDGLGRYSYLKRLIETQGEQGLREFFRQVCVFTPEKRALRRVGALIKLRLWLPQKIETWFPGSHAVAARGVSLDPESGRLVAETDHHGSKMLVTLDDNYTETMIANGTEPEPHEVEAVKRLVEGRQTVFWDVGANAGVYSLLVARHAAADSRVVSFEPNPTMVARFQRNVALNGYSNVELKQVALGAAEGEVSLRLQGNLGQASVVAGPDQSGAAISVRMSTLARFVAEVPRGDINVLKIDIEGGEADCLHPFFAAAPESLWPDYVLFEHAHTDEWSRPPESVFPQGYYEVARKFANNTLLRARAKAA